MDTMYHRNFRGKSGQREAAVFIWDVQKLINKEAPELHLLWHGLRGARPEAALSPDVKSWRLPIGTIKWMLK